MSVTLSTTSPQLVGLDRRRLLGGLCILTTGLGAGVTTLAGRWSNSPAEAPPRIEPASTYPTPPVHNYSARLCTEWATFRRRYVAPEGRVVDPGSSGVSHSEGQGWGLMAAQAADDEPGFAQILAWTTQNLQRRPHDSLHAWRFTPDAPSPVADLNNATGGDLFIAAALARAAARWNRPDYAAQATRMARDILGLVRQAAGRTLLLPGAEGFETPDSYVLNPSHYGFALFADLAVLAPSPHWGALRQDGRAMLLQARFGRWMLPPDWLRVNRRDGELAMAPGWPTRFSYDAIRVPLHLIWGDVAAEPLLEAFRRYWMSPRSAPPAWTDLRTGDEAAYPASAGLRAVATVAAGMVPWQVANVLPSVMNASDYYSGGLILLSRMAAEENAARQAA